MRICDDFAVNAKKDILEYTILSQEQIANRYMYFDISDALSMIRNIKTKETIPCRPPFKSMLLCADGIDGNRIVIAVDERDKSLMCMGFQKPKGEKWWFIGCAPVNCDDEWNPKLGPVEFQVNTAQLWRKAPTQQILEAAGTIAMRTMQLLNCKNVLAKEKETNIKKSVVEHMKKTNKPPIKKQYTLCVEVLSFSGTHSSTDAKQPTQMPLHICRGHFAVYGEEKKLFGKYTGAFWIPAHMKGSEKNGEIKKDYQIRGLPEFENVVSRAVALSERLKSDICRAKEKAGE